VSDSSDNSMNGEKHPLSAQARDKRGRKASPDDPFDLWLDHGLRKMFGDVENEPIPPDLLALIKRDREKG